jgi:hypothetical protein
VRGVWEGSPSGETDLSRGEVLVYETPEGKLRVDVRLERETVWQSLAQMAGAVRARQVGDFEALAQRLPERGLAREAVVAKNATTAADGKTYQVEYFNLDVIISVGYRIKSLQGTRFRWWRWRC